MAEGLEIEFATITPINLDGRLDIRETWNSIQNKFGPNSHYASFLRFLHSPRSYQYVLRFTSRHPVDRGWALGTGGWNLNNPTGLVDILFAQSLAIRNRHATLNFDEYGRFYLRTRHPGVELDGEPLEAGSTRLLGYTNSIRIGTLLYRYQFNLAPQHRQAFQTRKDTYVGKMLNRKELPSPITSVNPSRNDQQVGDWIMHRVAGESSNTVVRAASNKRTLEVVAAKRILRRSARDARSVEAEVAKYQELSSLKSRDYGRYIMHMRDVLYPADDDQSWSGQTDEVFMLWQPVGQYTFREFGRTAGHYDVPLSIKLDLFAQVMAGLHAVHEYGWLHRDIKPANLYVVSLEPPHAIIGDFGQAAAIGRSGLIGLRGTHGYSAPEVQRNERYTYTADVWSLGATGIYLLLEGHLPWYNNQPNLFVDQDKTHYDEYLRYIRSLESQGVSSSLHRLLLEMVKEEPEERIALRSAVRNESIAQHIAAVPL